MLSIFLINRSLAGFPTLLVVANGVPTRNAHKNNRDVSVEVQLLKFASWSPVMDSEIALCYRVRRSKRTQSKVPSSISSCRKYQRLTPQTCHATFQKNPLISDSFHQTNLSYLSLARHAAHVKCPCLQTPETLGTIACRKTLPADRFFSSFPMPQAAIYSY